MRKAKKLSNKLMAILLSASMVFVPVMQSMPVYAAEPVIEEESADTPTDNATTDEPDTDNNDSDTPDTDNGDSENQGTESGDTENPGTENGDSDNSGTENGDADNSGTENGDSDNTGTEDGDSENSGTEDGDTENPEDPDAEDGDSEDLGDAEADESLEEVQDETLEAIGGRAAGSTTSTITQMTAKGWNESIYAEVSGIKAADVAEVSYSGDTNGELSEEDLQYLVRDKGNIVRIDILGLKKNGTYSLTVKALSGSTKTVDNIKVYAYDRSGYAHFNYTSGVGAYKDDGTLKEGAIVLYVTDQNKNDVELTVGSKTVKGIGNILNSVGQNTGNGTTSNGGKPNTNAGIIKALALTGKPLVVRFIGTVSESKLYSAGSWSAADAGEIDGLTDFDSTDNGGSVGDNGHMARIQSGKDITLEGIGTDAVIDGWGFHYIAEGSSPELGKSFEVRNLTFINTPEDAVGMEGQMDGQNVSAPISSSVERCWVHNNEFYCPSISGPAESDKAQGDGSVDFKRGNYFTCSYNYFESCHKTNLVGSAKTSLQYNLTYHHNYYYRCGSRGPLSRNANIHMYNNVYELQSSYAMDARANAYIFAEYNLFYASKSPHVTSKEGGGTIKSYKDSFSSVLWDEKGNIVDDKSTYIANNCQYQAGNIKYDKFDLDSTQSYIPDNDYDLQTDFMEMRAVLASQLGVQDENPIPIEKITPDNYSMVVKSGADIKQITPPFNDAPGKISKDTYAFNIEGSFNISVKYGANTGILINDAGENLLEGSGELINLPAGRYMIQPSNIDPSKTGKNIWKDCNIDSIVIEAYDKDAHYHKWVEDTTQYKAATCTEKGKKVYKCAGCNETKEEEIPLIAHSYVWVVDKEATETEAGERHQECSVCHDKKAGVTIPAGGSGGTGGGDTGIVTEPGDYVLNFEGKKVIDDSKFFTVNDGGGYSDSKGDVIVNGTTYRYSLKMASSTVTFSCNEGATLFLAFAPGNAGLKVMVGEDEKTIGADGTITIKNMPAGTYTIKKGNTSSEKNLTYVSVTNPPTEEIFYTLSFEYNYDDAPDAQEVQVVAGKRYASMAELAPASFTRRNHQLKGLYTDADCEHEVSYEYVVNGDATFYADWEENYGPAEKTYSVIFNSKGGSDIVTARVTDSQIYTITEKPTRDGFAFAGWYDAEENGKLVEVVDGTKLTGSITLYAYWNSTEVVDEDLSLDCSKDLNNVGTDNGNGNGERNITALTTVKGFKIHALDGEGAPVGSDNKNTKYYMTVKNNLLYTNGVLLPDTSVTGKNDEFLKSIEFTTTGAGILTVGVAASGSISGSTTCNIALAKMSDGALQIIRQQSITSTSQSNKEFEIDAAGTYYLYATGTKGVAYSSIKFTQPTYTILYQTKGGTAENSESVTKKAGEKIALPITSTKPGYTFKGWLIGSSTSPVNGGTEYTVDSDDASYGVITITADYTPIIYTIEYDAKGGSIGNGGTSDNDVLEYAAGTVITLKTPTPPSGYEFAGWKVVGSSDNKLYGKSYTVRAEDAVSGNKITFEAVYEKAKEEYTVRFVAGAGTLPAGMSESVVRLEEETISLGECTPTDSNQKFIGWRVGDAGSIFNSSYTVNANDADENKIITINAVYGSKEQNSFTVTIDTNGGNLVGVGSTTITVMEGDKLPDIRCKREGYRFVGWTVGDSDDVIDISTYIVEGNITIKAKYEEGSSHEGIAIVGLEPKYEYTGANIIPDIGVVDYNIGDDGKMLAPGVDYTVKYKDNKKPGDATIIVTGKGNYVGKDIQKKFKIEEVKKVTTNLANLKSAKIAKINNVEYTGEKHYPDFTLTLKGESAVTYTYDNGGYVIKTGQSGAGTPINANVAVSNNVNKGTATILITGATPEGKKNAKATSVKKTFKITAIDLAKNSTKVNVTTTPGTYSVKGAAPGSIKVTYGGKELRKGIDYTVKYTGNKKVTTSAQVVITGKGNYAKKITGNTYSINKLDMSGLEVKAVNACEGIKAGKVKATVLDKEGNILKPSQYTLNVYDAEQNAYDASKPLVKGTIYVEAKAKDTVNLTKDSATAKAPFTVAEKAKNIAKAKFVLNKVNNKAFTAQYTGKEIELNESNLTVTMKGVSGNLKMGTDFVIAGYSNNINKGTATAIIKGIGSYSGTKTVKFKIVGKTMAIDGEDGITWDDVTDVITSFMKNIVK
ncbi:MAG: hypothetical protein HDR03_11735 [Lachnospiraceae bacterium]|nr:hypothetical protein [Lachnospiraceae bacterium]